MRDNCRSKESREVLPEMSSADLARQSNKGLRRGYQSNKGLSLFVKILTTADMVVDANITSNKRRSVSNIAVPNFERFVGFKRSFGQNVLKFEYA